MKLSYFIAILFIFSFVSIDAQTSDRDLVTQTLNYYLEGGTNNDFETLKKAFHETATMKYIGDAYTEVNAREFFGSRMKPGPKQNRETRITNISIDGHAASARIEIEYPTFMFIDYMNLLRIDGDWKIVNKIFYRQAKDSE